MVRRAVFEDINGFDERLETDEDCDFGGRLHKAGYFMLEDPDIRVVHLGNPKSLQAFYQKEKWHATNALAAKFSELFDRPTIMSILFGITILVSVVCMAASVWIDINYLWAVLLVLLLPLTTAVYRAYQFKKYRYIPELTLLWGIFFMVRINNMVKHLFFKGVANV